MSSLSKFQTARLFADDVISLLSRLIYVKVKTYNGGYQDVYFGMQKKRK